MIFMGFCVIYILEILNKYNTKSKNAQNFIDIYRLILNKSPSNNQNWIGA